MRTGARRRAPGAHLRPCLRVGGVQEFVGWQDPRDASNILRETSITVVLSATRKHARFVALVAVAGQWAGASPAQAVRGRRATKSSVGRVDTDNVSWLSTLLPPCAMKYTVHSYR